MMVWHGMGPLTIKQSFRSTLYQRNPAYTGVRLSSGPAANKGTFSAVEGDCVQRKAWELEYKERVPDIELYQDVSQLRH